MTNTVANITANDYAFTYKKNVKADEKGLVSREDYDIILRHIVECGGSIRFVYYEIDTFGQFHVHGSCQFGTVPSYKNLSYKGYSSRWKKVYDICGWEDYCSKDNNKDNDKEEDSLITINLFNRHPINNA